MSALGIGPAFALPPSAAATATNAAAVAMLVNRRIRFSSRVSDGAAAICVGFEFGAISNETMLRDHAARSIV
jgi:hypothetical protein